MASSPADSDLNPQQGDPDPNPNLCSQEELDFSILFDYDYINPVAGLCRLLVLCYLKFAK